MSYGKFKRFDLTDKQIRGVANIIMHENGTCLEGLYAEASLIANRAELNNESIEKTCTGGWFAFGRTRFTQGTSNATAIRVAENVLLYGYRTLELYVNEHDCYSDIASAKNGDENVRADRHSWIRLKTKIKNVYSSKWWFCEFPGGLGSGVDPFGTTFDKEKRDELGHFKYTVKQAEEGRNKKEKYKGKLITQYPKRGYFQKGDKYKGVKIIQDFLNWNYDKKKDWIPLDPDKSYGEKTESAVRRFQKDKGLPVNGKWGKLCNDMAKVAER